MRFISRKAHAMLDYMTGILLIAAPWLFNFADVDAAKWVAIAVGAMILVMSFITDYEGGGAKTLSMGTHLTMDVLAGIFLAASPWLFNFDEFVYLPHLIVGIFEIIAGLCTDRVSQHSHTHHVDNVRHAH
ncbi:SPW repeat protein [Pedobacter sp. SYSU D00535]|uniref:SPW repeat domain-containing protein n=1 Tax=Pedobacter sp. SYSU D00535 TaxID=2810308 RepID=UPI001A970B98|nr:SPW repeat protein [Pedobacter sp. SYSU D00535]